MTKLLQLTGSVGPGQCNEEDDVAAFDNAMRGIGAYVPPPEYADQIQRYLTGPVVDATRSFQEQNGLKIDGYAEANGETERAINNRLLEKPRGAGLLHDFEMSLDGTVGSGFRNDERDVKKAKRALGGLGYMPEDPFDEPSGFIDERTDRAIRNFQDDQDLRVDGWMRPGGPTETALRTALDDLSKSMRPAWERYHRRAQQHESLLEPAQFRPKPRPVPAPWPPVTGAPSDEQGSDRLMPALPPPPVLAPGPLDWILRGRAAPRETDIVPPELHDFADLTRSVEPTLLDDLIVPMRGSQETQDQNNRLAVEFKNVATRFGCNFEHEGGGNEKYDSANERKKEKYIPAKPQHRDARGRLTTKDSAYGDIHLVRGTGEKARHVVLQTVDTYARGGATARELRNAVRILRNGGKNFYVLLFPKLPEGWTFNDAAFEALAKQLLDKVCSDEERDDPEDDRKFEFRDPLTKRTK